MSHATESQLLAYHDGEIDGSAAADLAGHLAVCARCTEELAGLRRLSDRSQAALSELDVPAPMLRTRAAIAAARRAPAGAPLLQRVGARSLAKAAVLLLVLAGAISALIPGSPLRLVLETAIARLSEPVPQEGPIAPQPPAAEAPGALVNTIYVYPADGRVRVIVHAPVELDVVARLAEEAETVAVVTSSPDPEVRFRSATGRVEVSGLTQGTLEVAIPMDLQSATLEIGGQVHVYKDGDELRLSGPAGTGRGEEVRFRIGG